MIAMRPIREYDVIDLLNNGRFEGEVEGYVVMDGSKYLGHMLYRVDGAVTQVLECGVEEKMFVDGAVRACVAAGENAGDGGLHILIDHRAVGAGRTKSLPNGRTFSSRKRRAMFPTAVFSILANNFTEIITETLVIDLSK